MGRYCRKTRSLDCRQQFLKKGVLFASYFITLLGDNRNQSFAIYLPPDFFNSIHPFEPFAFNGAIFCSRFPSGHSAQRMKARLLQRGTFQESPVQLSAGCTEAKPTQNVFDRKAVPS